MTWTWSRRSAGGIALLAAATLACGAPPRVDRVVLVTIDTLRADHVGSYGAERAHTSTLDALAGRGVRFATALSPVPITLPAHTTLMTGLEPPRHGVRDNSIYRVPDDVPTLAERFHDGGFATAAFVGAAVLDHSFGLDRGFERYDDRMGLRHTTRVGSSAERTADQVIDAALDWLGQAPERFLLWVHLYDPHGDYAPPSGFRVAFPGDLYAGEIAFADAQLARLIEALDARFDPSHTLVVATSDHGESRGEHGEPTHSFSIYDATQRIPLILRGPGLPAGRVAEDPVGLVDLAPTLLGMAGLEPLPEAAGLDLRGVLDGAAPAGRTFYLETLSTQIQFGWSPLLGLRTADEKFIRAPRPELYDLRADPGETRNLAARRPARAAELDAALEKRLVRGGRSPHRVAPEPDMRRRLEALGYLTASAGHEAAELGRVAGPDPKDELPKLQALFASIPLLAQGRASEALERLEQVEGGGYLFALFRSRAALAAGLSERAERYAREAIRSAPNFAGAHQTLGLALLEQDRLGDARAAFEEASRLDATSAEAEVGLGRVAEARGDLDAARRHYREGIARGGSAEAHWRLAALDVEAGAWAAADARLEAISEEDLSLPEAALRLARAEVRVGRRDRALRRLDDSQKRWASESVGAAYRALLAEAEDPRQR